jgi:tetratricopeptide (TPR) repeat protein
MLETFVQRREGVLLLIGEAGVGKTRLAVEGARLAEHAHAVILTGVGTELEGLAPYAPFMDAWADYLRLSGAPPTDSPFVAFTPTPTGAPQEDKLRLLQSVQQSLEALSSGKPVYLIIDDLHLVDESSLHLFHYLARATRTQPLMLVATCREEDLRPHTPVQALLSSLYRERLAQRYVVERLDLTATHQHVADLFGTDPGQALALAVYERTAGNPFYTEEVVQALQETGRHTAPLTVPRDLLNTVRERMTRLGMRAETLLVVAAVLGQRFAFEPACKAAGLPMTAALTALQRSLEARVIEEDEHGYRFRHSLMREALYSTLPRPRRVQLHRAVARALEAEAAADQDDLAEALAHHYQAGEQPDRALLHLITAGQRAATRVGLREAVTFFEQALKIMEHLQRPPGPERFAILYGLGQMRVALSDIEAAVHDLDTAAGLTRPADGWQPTPGERAQARRWAALACIAAGDLEAAQVRLHAALADLAASPGDPELPNVLYHLAQLRWHEGQHREAYEIAERCLREAEHVGDPQTIGRGYEMLALACHALGEWRDGLGFEAKRQQLVGSAVDVAQAFDVHL